MLYLLDAVIYTRNPVNEIMSALITVAEISAVIIFWSFIRFLDMSLLKKYSWLKPTVSILPIVAIGMIPVFDKWRFYSIESVIGIAFITFLAVFGVGLIYIIWGLFFEYLKKPSVKKNDNYGVVSISEGNKQPNKIG